MRSFRRREAEPTRAWVREKMGGSSACLEEESRSAGPNPGRDAERWSAPSRFGVLGFRRSEHEHDTRCGENASTDEAHARDGAQIVVGSDIVAFRNRAAGPYAAVDRVASRHGE